MGPRSSISRWNRLLGRRILKSVYLYIWYFYHRKLVKCRRGSAVSQVSAPFREAACHYQEDGNQVGHIIEQIDTQWLMKNRGLRRIYLPVVLIFFWVIRAIVVIGLHLFVPNILENISAKHIYMFLGSPFHLLGSPTIHSETMAITWGINVMVQYFLVVHNPRTGRLFLKANVLINLLVFYDESYLKKRGTMLGTRSEILRYPMLNDPLLGLMRNVDLVRFRQVSRVCMSGIWLFNFAMAGNVTFTTLAIAYYDFCDTPLECVYVLLVCTPIWTVYTYVCAIYAYYVFFYFVVFASFFRCVMLQICNHMQGILDECKKMKQRRSLNSVVNGLMPLRCKSIYYLMLTYNRILCQLQYYHPLWSLYITIVLIIFNGNVCFNFYLFIYTDSAYYIKMVYIATSLTAFNIFFSSNYFAAKFVTANIRINRPLFGLFSERQIGKQKLTNIKLLDCVTNENVGMRYVDQQLITMRTLNSIVYFLFMGFVLFINLSSAKTIDSK